MTDSLAEDVARVGRIDAVPSILDVVCRITGMGFAAVARVTPQRWVACAVKDDIAFGLKPGGELKIETTICNEIRQSGTLVVIDHVAEDAQYRGHPTPAMYGFQSYISVPIYLADKSFFGTLCAIDPRPAKVNRPEVIETFQLFGELIAMHLDMDDRLASTEAALLTEREAADLRDQFIAVLGHDLRNPLASVKSGITLLKRSPGHDNNLLGMMQQSVDRMTELVGNMLDLASGRLGGGLKLDRVNNERLAADLQLVTDELRAAWPRRRIESDISTEHQIAADPARVAQLLSNLVSNALVHGSQTAPVRILGRTGNGVFELSVSNEGEPIPPAILGRLFQPFFRTAGPKQGLGLGLYIAAEIARAHGGKLTATSDASETRFTLTMPLG